MDRQEAIKLLKRFITEDLKGKGWFQKIKPEVRAIIFYGSRSKGTNRNDSDFDLLIIVPLEIEKQYTDGEYLYDFEGEKVNIVLRSVEKIRDIADLNNDEFQKEIFDKSEILYAPDKEVEQLLFKIAMI